VARCRWSTAKSLHLVLACAAIPLMGGGNAARRRWSAVWASCRRWAGTAWRRLGARAAAPRAPLHACRAPDRLASGGHARGRLCCCVLAGRLAMAPALCRRRALVPCERMRPARHASRSPRAQQAHRLDSTRAGAGGPAPHKRGETRPGRRAGAPASACSAGSSASWACTRAGGWRARRSATSRSAARARTASRPRCAWTGARSSRTSTASGRRTRRVRAAE